MNMPTSSTTVWRVPWSAVVVLAALMVVMMNETVAGGGQHLRLAERSIDENNSSNKQRLVSCLTSCGHKMLNREFMIHDVRAARQLRCEFGMSSLRKALREVVVKIGLLLPPTSSLDRRAVRPRIARHEARLSAVSA